MMNLNYSIMFFAFAFTTVLLHVATANTDGEVSNKKLIGALKNHHQTSNDDLVFDNMNLADVDSQESSDSDSDEHEQEKRLDYRYGKRLDYRYGKRSAMPYRFGKRSGGQQLTYQQLRELIKEMSDNDDIVKRLDYRYGRK